MKAALNWLGNLLVAVSVGTLLTLVVVVGMLWWKGALSDERWLAMLAALQGIEPAKTPLTNVAHPADGEQPSIDQLLSARLRASLDLDLRESAIDKSLGDLRALDVQVRTESQRLDQWKRSFDQRLVDLETAATNAALLELQRTLEALQPKQAKDQLMKMLGSPPSGDDNPLYDVVTLMKAMPLDKRKKILGEFKTDEEIEKLAEILHQIRLGAPDTQVLQDTRNQLQQQLNPQP